MLDWLAEERDSLSARVAAVTGRAEFGLQVSYDPAVVLRQITEEDPEVRRLEAAIRTQTAGLAYLSRQELERVLRRQMEQHARDLFKSVYERARTCAEKVAVEKLKHDGAELRMAANLSCLVATDRISELKALADEMAVRAGQTVRLVGPLPPYSFC